MEIKVTGCKLNSVLIAAFLVSVCVTSNCFGTVWYVDKDNSSGTDDGTTWNTAFDTNQEGIDAAFNAGGGEVWVANEARMSIVHAAPNDVNTGSIVMKENVALYGGFIGAGVGGNETDRSQRDWTANVKEELRLGLCLGVLV